MSTPTQGRRPLFEDPRWILLLPFAVGVAVYGFTLGHAFVFDDNLIVLGNPQITEGVTLRELFLSDWFDRSGVGGIGYYRPITKASFRLDYLLAGASPAYFHGVNVLLHALNAALVGLLGWTLLGSRPGLIGGLLFALHPTTAEAVSIVTARSDLLATLFLLGGLLCFAAWRRLLSAGWLAGSLLLFALALGSKESVLLSLTLLPILARLEGDTWRGALFSSAPFLLLFAAFFLLRSACALPMGDNHLASLGAGTLALSVLQALGSYLEPLVLARPILQLPSIPEGLFEPGVLGGISLLLLAAILAARDRLSSPLVLLLAFGLITLAPALVLWKLKIPQWHESLPMTLRWLYTPSVAFCLGLGWLLSLLRGVLQPVLVVGVGIALLPLTLYQAASNEDELAYARYLLQGYAEVPAGELDPMERYQLLMSQAMVANEEGDLDTALKALQQAITEAPFHGSAWELVARYESRRGNHDAAEKAARLILSDAFWEDPRSREEHRLMGGWARNRIDRPALRAVLARAAAVRGDLAEAQALIDQVVEESAGTAPEFQYRFDQGKIRELRGDYAAAREAYLASAQLRPDWYGARLQLARLELKDGNPGQARKLLEGLAREAGPGAEPARKLLESFAP
ncbi:MAG: tetratricopeptide repeat protein [Deltaproteobacteria bacterium]|nr:tetratricopeptide repeat protein [Deltaproteobacteria bacterium]